MCSNRKLFSWALPVALLLSAAVADADNGRGRHQKIYVVPTPGKVIIDGKLDDWDLSGQIMMCVVDETSEMQSARSALMYDADALYVSGVVRDPTPLLNRHDPKVEPDRAWDADACQIYLSVDPTLGYPITKFNADGEVPGLMDMYTKTQSGFDAVVTIPLATIGWTPRPGQTIKLDFGCVFGNATGQAVSLRAYWTNHGFAAGVNNDVPNESRLEPNEWGTASVA